MSKSKHTEAQIIAALSQVDGNLDTSFVRRVSELIGGTLKGQADPSHCRNPRQSIVRRDYSCFETMVSSIEDALHHTQMDWLVTCTTHENSIADAGSLSRLGKEHCEDKHLRTWLRRHDFWQDAWPVMDTKSLV